MWHWFETKQGSGTTSGTPRQFLAGGFRNSALRAWSLSDPFGDNTATKTDEEEVFFLSTGSFYGVILQGHSAGSYYGVILQGHNLLVVLCLLYCSLNFMYFLRARHDHSKIAPCRMIKVFELNWIELNWIEFNTTGSFYGIILRGHSRDRSTGSFYRVIIRGHSTGQGHSTGSFHEGRGVHVGYDQMLKPNQIITPPPPTPVSPGPLPQTHQSPREFFSADSLTVFVQPPCAIACINIMCAR